MGSKIMPSNVNTFHEVRNSRIASAIANNNPHEAQEQIDRGFDVNLKLGDGFDTPILSVIVSERAYDVLETFLKAGANIHASCCEGDTPLHEAAAYNDPTSLQILIDAGADVNKRAEFGHTPLFYTRSRECQEILIEAGADPTLRNNHGQSVDEVNLNRCRFDVLDVHTDLCAQYEAKLQRSAISSALEDVPTKTVRARRM